MGSRSAQSPCSAVQAGPARKNAVQNAERARCSLAFGSSSAVTVTGPSAAVSGASIAVCRGRGRGRVAMPFPFRLPQRCTTCNTCSPSSAAPRPRIRRSLRQASRECGCEPPTSCCSVRHCLRFWEVEFHPRGLKARGTSRITAAAAGSRGTMSAK
jgi:hypothetical protein